MKVEILVPWRGGCRHRAAAWVWVCARYAASSPGWSIRREVQNDGPWRKGLAVARAVSASDADVVAVADADVWSSELPKAVAEVEAGAPWAMPHSRLIRLGAGGTRAILAGETPVGHPLDQPPYRGIDGGGIVVLSREVLTAVPIDPRFEGWGQEDESWAIALRTLLGPAWRGDGVLVHLWHPPQARASRRHGSPTGWALRRRYVRARNEPRAMSALIGEAHEHLGSVDPALHRGASGRV